MVGPHFSWPELVIRLGSALVFGSVIGAERQWRQRTAGLRTYSLVSIGAALFVLLAPLTGVRGESTRVAAQVISGVGFLGAGVLMRTGLTVHGLNTASTIWCSAAIGVLSGGGFFAAAFLGTTYELLLLLRPKGKQEMTSLLQAAVARDRDARMAFVKAGIPRAGQRYQFERASEDTPTNAAEWPYRSLPDERRSTDRDTLPEAS